MLPLPQSDFYTLRSTADAGRTVLATQDIQAGIHLLSTSQSLSPIAHVILRPYRREVCAECFAYERGREWKLRSLWSVAGVVFCSEQCEVGWKHRCGDLGIAAYAAAEAAVRAAAKHKGSSNAKAEHSIDQYSAHPAASIDDVDEEWTRTNEAASILVAARTSSSTPKAAKRALRAAQEGPFDPDILAFLISGVVHAASDLPSTSLSASLLALVPDDDVFSSRESLTQYTQAYLLLCAILPASALTYLSPELCRELASRSSHNAFSIRPTGSSDGEQSGEFMGWGVWPEASFFNHSCSPGVKKERKGRQWFFTADMAIAASDELCITYLGGDERDLEVTERQKWLHEHWGFWCRCSRCVRELETHSG